MCTVLTDARGHHNEWHVGTELGARLLGSIRSAEPFPVGVVVPQRNMRRDLKRILQKGQGMLS